VHARFISITNTSKLQVEGNKTHAIFILARVTTIPTTLHYEINLVHAKFPSSPKISTSPITALQGERNLMCFKIPSSINASKHKHCKVKEL